MAEILTITTPLVNKSNQVQPNKQVTDPTIPFHLQDVPTVPKSPGSKEQMLPQNNGLIERENSGNVLTSLLKDPAAAVSFMKNIDVLQEVIKLLPANNSPVTQEIEQLFSALLIRPEDITAEMLRQENTSTVFRGELFNYLRGLLGRNRSPEAALGVATLLKSINSFLSRQDSLGAAANSLQFLSESLAPSKDLSQRLMNLSQAFRREGADVRFAALKKEALALLGEVEGSLLFSPRLDKVLSITRYNLSRFNDNPDFFQEAVSNLALLLDKQERSVFSEVIRSFRLEMKRMGGEEEMSKIMDVLSRIIGAEASEKNLSLSTSEKIEKIIYSLLSSPCHFTPLLHFVVPVEFGDLKSFAEMWVNPNGQEDRREPGREDEPCTHMLLAFDVEGLGQFEAEVYALGRDISLALFCPPAYADAFAGLAKRFQSCAAGTPYQMADITVGPLTRPRSLMDVFKSLPYKRTGVDVKV